MVVISVSYSLNVSHFPSVMCKTKCNNLLAELSLFEVVYKYLTYIKCK